MDWFERKNNKTLLFHSGRWKVDDGGAFKCKNRRYFHPHVLFCRTAFSLLRHAIRRYVPEVVELEESTNCTSTFLRILWTIPSKCSSFCPFLLPHSTGTKVVFRAAIPVVNRSTLAPSIQMLSLYL